MFIAYRLINEGIIYGFNYDLTPNIRAVKEAYQSCKHGATTSRFISLSTARANEQKYCAADEKSIVVSCHSCSRALDLLLIH